MISATQGLPSSDLSHKTISLSGPPIFGYDKAAGSLEDDHGTSSSSDAESASSGDTEMTDPSGPLAASDATNRSGGSQDICGPAVAISGLTKYEKLKDILHWPIKGRVLASSGPEAFNWFSPSAVPSPAAFHVWRREMCKRYGLQPSSADERSFYEHFIDANYSANIRQRVKDDQQRFERHLLRCQGRIKDNEDVQAGVPLRKLTNAEHEVYERIDWIFNGVAEAVCRHSLPKPTVQQQSISDHHTALPSPAEQTPKNKKGFPLVYYIERNNFHEQWIEYCRTQASNTQNVLYDYAPFASHNPYSLYHKVKYGDFGSPHPYVPYAITNAKEWKKSCEDQARQETEALAWLVRRRMQVGTTQQELDITERRLRGGKSEPTSLSQVHSMTGLQDAQIQSNGTDISFIPLSVADDVVVDQETEQPQAMGVRESTTPLVSTQAANCARPQHELGAGPDTLNNTSVSAATSISHPITISVIVPEELMPWLRSNVYKQLKTDHPDKVPYLCDDSRRHLLSPKMHSQPRTSRPAVRDGETPVAADKLETLISPAQSRPLVRLRPMMNLSAIVTDDEVPWRSGGKMLLQEDFHDPQVEATALHSSLTGAVVGPRWSSATVKEADEPPPSFKLGNLFLSSCPGKKVRLTGAVKGRGAVCRDLAIDLQRFKAFGVGTLVCCLSDAELGVIGVKWEDYVFEADKSGLDLVRVPMVEGNCPTTQEYLDAWLEEIVLNCTLKGVNVLVHCRGGVGRAGTIAACWLVKMGLVDEFRPSDEAVRRGETMPEQELLWQSLQVIRMRRSSKAIETAEQAAYIAKYGDYLIARWQDAHPGEEYIESDYRNMVSSYWSRIRRETDQWVRQILHEASERREGNNKPSGGDFATSDAPAAESNGHHHSDIRTKSAAVALTSRANAKASGTSTGRVEVPISETKTEGSSASPMIHPAAYPSPQGPLLQRKASLTIFSIPIESEVGLANSSGADISPVSGLDRSEDGEPSRKRRNTASLSVDDMKLSDEEDNLTITTTPVTLDASPVVVSGGGGGGGGGGGSADVYDGTDVDVEAEFDAFPVNGQRQEERNRFP